MKDLKRILESEVLPLVSRPGRYIGGEVGSTPKSIREADVRIALAFPDVYEIGMSHLGVKILYGIVNERPGLAAERVFAPWPDMEDRLRERGMPLYGLETFTPLALFDVIGFSLQYELTYTNILTMLDCAGLPLFSAERARRPLPLVVAGGPGACVPGPLEEFVDLFIVGDGEEAIINLLDVVRWWKEGGGVSGDGAKGRLLAEIARRVEGAYAPSLYEKRYSPAGKLLSHSPIVDGVPARVKRRVVGKIESSRWLKKAPVPLIGVVHDRIAFEVRRGCGRGCRFCQAGMIYRPVRDEAPEAIAAAAREAIEATGYDEIALCALSVGDYPHLDRLAGMIVRERAPIAVSLSLPSLRPDRIARGLAEKLGRGRKTGITLAPEAGGEALRRRINKRIALGELMCFVRELRRRGWRAVKLYFMIGLPGETDDDLRAAADLIDEVAGVGKEGRGRWEVNVTVSSFIPKAHTPFQWEPMASIEDLRRKRALLRRFVKRRNVNMKLGNLEANLIEAVFSRGGPELALPLYNAWRRGCRFDGWRETFRPVLWREAFAEAGIDPEERAASGFADEEYLPWDIIETGVKKDFLLSERERARRAEYTPDCAERCAGCGVCPQAGAKQGGSEKSIALH